MLQRSQRTSVDSCYVEEQEKEKEPPVVLPYVAGMSEDIRRVCMQEV